MLLRTHLVFAVLFILLFIPYVESKIVFGVATFLTTLLPDIDTGFSRVGKYKIFKFLHFFVRHRSLIHSFTVCVLLTALLAIFLPVAALGFFLGYGLHLFLDSFTIDGIMPLWPLRKKSFWHLRTGGRIETSLFLLFVILDVVVFVFTVLI